jgi:hypothetical protein
MRMVVSPAATSRRSKPSNILDPPPVVAALQEAYSSALAFPAKLQCCIAKAQLLPAGSAAHISD